MKRWKNLCRLLVLTNQREESGDVVPDFPVRQTVAADFDCQTADVDLVPETETGERAGTDSANSYYLFLQVTVQA